MTLRRPHALAGALPRRPSSRWLALLGALLLLASLPATALAWDLNAFSSSDESLMVNLTNQRRASSGLPALTMDTTLRSVARWRSKDMIDRAYFGHSIPPNGTSVFDELRARGYCYLEAAENIGSGTWAEATATTTMEGLFEASTTHLPAILGSSYRRIGVGAYQSSTGKKVWTVLFAKSCAPAATSTSRPVSATARPPAPTPKPAETLTPAVGDAPAGDQVLGAADASIDPLAQPRSMLWPVLQWVAELIMSIIRSLLAMTWR